MSNCRTYSNACGVVLTVYSLAAEPGCGEELRGVVVEAGDGGGNKYHFCPEGDSFLPNHIRSLYTYRFPYMQHDYIHSLYIHSMRTTLGQK